MAMVPKSTPMYEDRQMVQGGWYAMAELLKSFLMLAQAGPLSSFPQPAANASPRMVSARRCFVMGDPFRMSGTKWRFVVPGVTNDQLVALGDRSIKNKRTVKASPPRDAPRRHRAERL